MRRFGCYTLALLLVCACTSPGGMVIHRPDQDGGVGADSGSHDGNMSADRSAAPDTGAGRDSTTTGQDAAGGSGAGLCEGCTDDGDCGGPSDFCLTFTASGEQFCAQDCPTGSCPSGYYCVAIDSPAHQGNQCVPDANTCQGGPVDCNPPCLNDLVCRNGQCVDPSEWDAEQQHCVDEINRHRAANGRSALSRSAQVEECAMAGAEADALSGQPHGHFQQTAGCGGVARAENEIPGWPLASYGSVTNIITQGTQMMMDEGPGGGHHDNILDNHSSAGCGIYITANDEVWVVQNFR